MCVERITSVFSFFFLSSDEFRNKKRERGEEKIRGGGRDGKQRICNISVSNLTSPVSKISTDEDLLRAIFPEILITE